jgi:cellobiose-specific phosphotransferase system component IIB
LHVPRLNLIAPHSNYMKKKKKKFTGEKELRVGSGG